MSEEWLEIGRIVAPHGLRGELRVYPSTDFPERFEVPGTRWLRSPQAPNATPKPVELLRGRFMEGKGLYLIYLEGIADRNAAESLRDAVLLVPKSDRLPLEADEYHFSDLMGLTVYLHASGAELGTVTDIYTIANDLLEIELAETGEKVMVPFVREIVPVVDLVAGKLEIDPPAGLLELNRPSAAPSEMPSPTANDPEPNPD